MEPTKARIVSQPFGFFAGLIYASRAGIDDMVRYGNEGRARPTGYGQKGRALVSSDMQPDKIVEDGLAGKDGKIATLSASKKPARHKSVKDDGKSSSRNGNTNDNNVGHVLRSVYQKTIDEAIPAEMLDLLSKLD